ncbi:MAG: LapA family protein [Rhodobacteraceae bacterium]|nr:LapA family protein [Paracoccaceae bacterium]
MAILRYLKYLFWVLIIAVLLILSLANRQRVTLKLIPDDLVEWIGMEQTIDLPLFLVILGGIVIGLLVGFVWEWLREHRHRAEAKSQHREKQKLEREVAGLKGQAHKSKDEILALVEETGHQPGTRRRL